MDILVTSDGFLRFGAESFRCALGKGGIRVDKREGDGATPTGRYRLRRLYYRPDREDRPVSELPVHAIDENDGWCDTPGHPLYNRPVTLPFGAGCEKMWRGDSLYDIVIEIGHNDAPARKGFGSAVFIHVAAEGYKATEGCIALAKDDLRALAAQWNCGTWIEIRTDA